MTQLIKMLLNNGVPKELKDVKCCVSTGCENRQPFYNKLVMSTYKVRVCLMLCLQIVSAALKWPQNQLVQVCVLMVQPDLVILLFETS